MDCKIVISKGTVVISAMSQNEYILFMQLAKHHSYKIRIIFCNALKIENTVSITY